MAIPFESRIPIAVGGPPSPGEPDPDLEPRHRRRYPGVERPVDVDVAAVNVGDFAIANPGVP